MEKPTPKRNSIAAFEAYRARICKAVSENSATPELGVDRTVAVLKEIAVARMRRAIQEVTDQYFKEVEPHEMALLTANLGLSSEGTFKHLENISEDSLKQMISDIIDDYRNGAMISTIAYKVDENRRGKTA